VFAGNSNPDLRGYVVWVPKADGMRADVADAMTAMTGTSPVSDGATDPRLRHYWDGSGITMTLFDRVLHLGEDAWDVYLVYDRESRWDTAEPPAPHHWMHQLGSPDAPRVKGSYFSADTLARQVGDALKQPHP